MKVPLREPHENQRRLERQSVGLLRPFVAGSYGIYNGRSMATLVTGATGFVGVNIVEELVSRGLDVVALGLGGWPPEAASVLAADNLQTVDGDVRDVALLDRVFNEHAIDRVVHGAAITAGLEREIEDPGSIIDVNVRGVALVIEAAQRHGVGRFVHLSSGAAYGDALLEDAPVQEETTPSRPVTLYGLTKYAGELTALRLGDLYEMDLVCTRLGSVFGPWERTTGARDHVSVFLQLARIVGARETALLPPTPRTDFVYSRDVGLGVVALLAAKNLPRRVYNLSSGWEWEDLMAKWCRALATTYEGFNWRYAEAGEEPSIRHTEPRDRSLMDISRIAGEVGWKPQFSMQAAFTAYADWLVSVPNWLDPERSIQQRQA